MFKITLRALFAWRGSCNNWPGEFKVIQIISGLRYVLSLYRRNITEREVKPQQNNHTLNTQQYCKPSVSLFRKYFIFVILAGTIFMQKKFNSANMFFYMYFRQKIWYKNQANREYKTHHIIISTWYKNHKILTL